MKYPDTNKVYELRNHANGDFAGAYLGFTDSGVSLLDKTDADADEYNLKWFLFPIDDNQYIITSYGVDNSKVWTANDNKVNVATYFSGNAKQKWQIAELVPDSSLYVIKNIYNGLVLTAMKKDAGLLRLMDLTDEAENPYQLWDLNLLTTISLPKRPKVDKKLVPAPQYQYKGESLPDRTDPQLMGWTLVPCIMVNDSGISKDTQIKDTPFYILKKYQYWQKVAGSELSLHPHEKKEYKYHWGTTANQKVAVQSKLGFIINIDSGMRFEVPEIGGGSEDIKQQYYGELDISVSTETTEMKDFTEESTVENPADYVMDSVGYITMTDLKLYRYNHRGGNESLVTELITSNKDDFTISYWPNKDLALSLLTNHSYEEVEEITGISKINLIKLKETWKKKSNI